MITYVLPMVGILTKAKFKDKNFTDSKVSVNM